MRERRRGSCFLQIGYVDRDDGTQHPPAGSWGDAGADLKRTATLLDHGGQIGQSMAGRWLMGVLRGVGVDGDLSVIGYGDPGG